MLSVSPSTVDAITPHANGAFVMFVQVTAPKSPPGPIWIEGVRGHRLGTVLGELARLKAYDPMLIGLLETTLPPEQHAQAVRAHFDGDRLHDNWFEPTPGLLAAIQQDAQAALRTLIAQTHPGAHSQHPVGIDEIAAMLNVSVKTVRRLIEKQQIPYLRAGNGPYRFIPADVFASMQRR